MEAPTRPSRELVWPPPQEELDALEVVLLRSPAPSSTPSRTDASSDPSSSVAPLADPTQVSLRRRFLRIAAVAALMLVAMMVGVWLGARHARQSIAVASYSPAPASESAPATPARVEMPTSPTRPPSSALPTAAASPSPLPTQPAAARAPLAPSLLAPSSAAPPPQLVLASMAAAPTVAPPPSLSPSVSPSSDPAPTVSASEAAPPDTSLPDAKPLSDIPGTIGARQPPAPLAPAARRAEAASIQVTGPDEAGVRRALADYQRAYDTLDANAAAARWPSVDAAALARAFSGLKAQAVVFDRCQLLVGTSSARASCIGSATVVRQVGSARPVSEPRQWTFTLRRAGSNDWLIDNVQTDALTPALPAR